MDITTITTWGVRTYTSQILLSPVQSDFSLRCHFVAQFMRPIARGGIGMEEEERGSESRPICRAIAVAETDAMCKEEEASKFGRFFLFSIFFLPEEEGRDFL